MIRLITPPAPKSETIRQTLGHVVQDLVVLAELQGQLFRNDARESMDRIARPVGVLAASALLLAAAVLILLIAISEGLVAAGVPRAGAYAIVAIVGLAVAWGMALWAWRQFRQLPRPFAHSQEELVRNIAWIKSTLENNMAGKPHQPGSEVRGSNGTFQAES